MLAIKLNVYLFKYGENGNGVYRVVVLGSASV
jgi:hypothetical protein